MTGDYSRMRLESEFPIRGDLYVNVRNLTTNDVIRRYTVKNMIVGSGFAAVIRFLNDGNQNGIITSLRPGVGARNAETWESALGGETPDTGDTNIAGPIIKTGLEEYWDLPIQKEPLISSGSYQLKITATLDGGETTDSFNGVTVKEAGLFLANGDLFSRQIHPAVEKTPDIAIDYEWRISLRSTAPSA